MEKLIDLKLMKLIELCSVTFNYKKVAVVIFTLLSNRLDEIGIKLGIRPRNKEKNEKIYEYMDLINEIIQNNFSLNLFKEEMINRIRTIEILFLRKRGDISRPFIKDIITFYYNLRSILIPDIFQTDSKEKIYVQPSIQAFSFLRGNDSKKPGSRLRPLILQKLKEEERQAKLCLTNKYDPTIFEKTIRLKSIRNSIENENSNKIKIQGSLKDNFNYIRSKENIPRYLIIGFLTLFLMIGGIIVFQSILYPRASIGLSTYLLILFGSSMVLIFLYQYYKKSEGRE